jgi:hypothetical protein
MLVMIIFASSSLLTDSVQRQATGWTAGVRFPAVQAFSLLHSVQTGAGADPASYSMGTKGDFPGGKAAGA